MPKFSSTGPSNDSGLYSYYYELFQQMTTVDSKKAVRAITHQLATLNKLPDHKGQSISKVANCFHVTTRH